MKPFAPISLATAPSGPSSWNSCRKLRPRNQCVEHQPGDYKLQQPLREYADSCGTGAHTKRAFHIDTATTAESGGTDAPPGEVNLSWLRAFGAKNQLVLQHSRATIVAPSVGFYNLFNFANFDLPGASLNGLLTGAAGQIKGTTATGHNIDRVGIGTGVYSLGANRQMEFGLRLTF